MKTNQRYTEEEMYIAIELWQESNLSQSEFCKREGISYRIFLYWLKKYPRVTLRNKELTRRITKVTLRNTEGYRLLHPDKPRKASF